ncbi:MAG TPA: acyl-CoA dehydrogenase family protein [Geodermatophilus sp.]|nr:acyl-CoA dehydrogenase family protein [Geodermatophilus sp.]
MTRPRVDEGEAFLERLRAFLVDRVDPRQIEREARIPEDVIRGLEDLGALGMKIPREHGGLGLSQVYDNRTLAMAGTWHSSLSTLLSAHRSIGLPEPLRLFGSEEQKRTWLPRLARDHVSAFLLTEPDVGSDPARMSTTALPTEDGTGYRISGTELWGTNGAIADVVVVMAVVPESDGHRGGITAFICPCDREGITVEHRNEFMGPRGIENSVTRFDDVFVPTEDVIGGEGKGLRIALTTLNTGRLSLPAFSVSAVKSSLEIAREWSAERRQWGRPIGEHDPTAQKLAWLAGTAFGLEAVLDVSSRLADDKRNDIRIEAALAELYASELGWTAVDEHLTVAGDLVRGNAGPARKARAPRRRAPSTPPGSRGSPWAPASGRAPSPSSGSWPGTCATSSATPAGSRARPSTRWAATGRASSTRATCSVGSSTSAPSSTGSRARASMRTPSPASSPTAGSRPSNWPTCSAARPVVGPTGCSRSCGPTTTTPSTRPRSRCSPAGTRGSRRTCSTRRATAR